MNSVGLATRNLTVRYGGVVAVNDASLESHSESLTGLIGPNGAGKTSLFNACSGLVRIAGGRIYLDGQEITEERPAARGRLGLGRTFQKMQLFDALTVRENVALGREARLAGARIVGQLFATRDERQQVAAATEHAMSICELSDIAASRVGSLSTGQRRLVDLARVLAGGFAFLLLDEPSSGLTQTETVRLGRVLRSVRESGTGILLVEHDMSLVMDICDHIYVLDFGRIVFEGSGEEVAASETVRSVYLGSERSVGVR